MASIAATATAALSASTGSSATPSPKLVHAAHEFEGQMMAELLKPLMSGDGLDGDTSSGANGTLGEFATQSLGQALSEGGGFGIATQIIKELTPKSNKTVTTQVTTNLHGNTVMKSHE